MIPDYERLMTTISLLNLYLLIIQPISYSLLLKLHGISSLFCIIELEYNSRKELSPLIDDL